MPKVPLIKGRFGIPKYYKIINKMVGHLANQYVQKLF
jgi:hypothetical protein